MIRFLGIVLAIAALGCVVDQLMAGPTFMDAPEPPPGQPHTVAYQSPELWREPSTVTHYPDAAMVTGSYNTAIGYNALQSIGQPPSSEEAKPQ